LGETDIANKKIALRVDLNVPIKNENVLDDTRILAIVPTLEYLEKKAAKVLLLSHFGRPEPGIFNADFSLRPVRKRLAELLNNKVPFFKLLEDVSFDHDIGLLENTRFLAGELENDEDLSGRLANLAEVYIFDAFGTSHRAHASTHGAIQASSTHLVRGC
jgi:phosphoglycerate kinase